MPEVTSPEPADESNLSGTLANIRSIIIRRRWWILLPTCCLSLFAVGLLRLIPNRYTSAATLLVVSQQVPQRYVIPNSTMDLSSMLEAMKQEVLSHTQLLKMIVDFDLYPQKRKNLAPEQLMAAMVKDIDIAPISGPQQRGFDSFKISFTAENPLLAQQVTSTLTSLFINENLRTRTEQASNTTRFLHEQVAAKGKKLEEQEQQLRDTDITKTANRDHWHASRKRSYNDFSSANFLESI
jgi:succinoglycan biosynthesis transport protein ExoP